MSKLIPTTISLRGDFYVQKEDVAVDAIKPGHLLELVSGGVQKHSVVAGTARAAFAKENDYIGDGVEVEYAVGENVPYICLHSGQECLGRVAVGAPAIVKGDFLEPAADGTLRKRVVSAATPETGRNSSRFLALEAIDNSAGSVELFIRVEVL